MKKTFLIVMLCCIASVSAFAQTTKVVKGAVIDKDGNPLPGAVVEATGGAESAVVDADGTFSIEVPIWLKSLTAKYAGMKDKKKKISGSDMVFEMKQNSGGWFVNLLGSRELSRHEYYRVGLMGGYLSTWGGYLKFMQPVFNNNFNKESEIPSVSIGVIKSLTQSEYFYFGAGYSTMYEWCYYCYGFDEQCDGLMLEAGFIINLAKKFNITVGYSYSGDFVCYKNHEINAGIGFRF